MCAALFCIICRYVICECELLCACVLVMSCLCRAGSITHVMFSTGGRHENRAPGDRFSPSKEYQPRHSYEKDSRPSKPQGHRFAVPREDSEQKHTHEKEGTIVGPVLYWKRGLGFGSVKFDNGKEADLWKRDVVHGIIYKR
eukprot:TRINITY_DN10883_c0_g1_i1.p1 TRINITY_DN10883_c0_g1~~TRINITY_DN10883_c0_g1_i1.p1  ORF type:complete len:151 (+),score=20.12 TRINITY_DN10883_c0_g1_i1:33-455(+)